MVKLYISKDSTTGEENAYIYSNSHDRQELRQAASLCGLDPQTKYSLGFLDEQQSNSKVPSMIPLLHYNLPGLILDKAKSLFRIVDEEELSDDLDKVLKIVQLRLKTS